MAHNKQIKLISLFPLLSPALLVYCACLYIYPTPIIMVGNENKHSQPIPLLLL
jgi:hypothetical protein